MKGLKARLQKHLKEKPSTVQPDLMGELNIHALTNQPNQPNRIQQFAADLPDKNAREQGLRILRRVLLDAKKNEDNTYRFKISRIINEHDYINAFQYGEVPLPELEDVETVILPNENAIVKPTTKRNRGK